MEVPRPYITGRAERTPSTRRYTTQARAARAKAELEELEREQMKELREAKKDAIRRQKADEIAAMRAALKAQAQQRAAKRGKRKDGRRATDPTKASRRNAHKRALVPEQASTVADDEEERPVTVSYTHLTLPTICSV